MAEHLHSPAGTVFAAGAMRKPLQALQREVLGVRLDDDRECVHRMRVASRRLRNALDLFADELPGAARKQWRKRLKGVTQRLGAARDLDVQIEFLRRFLEGLAEPTTGDHPAPSARDGHTATLRPGIEYVLHTREARRAAAQAEVLEALERLESSRALAGLARWVKEHLPEKAERVPGSDELRVAAGRAVLRRLGDLFLYESYVERPEAAEELHAMRIAAKRLRYTLEAYAPLFPDALDVQIQWGRRLQDWLGEIHDCDVWDLELGRMLEAQATRPPLPEPAETPPPPPMPGMEHLRGERLRHRAAVHAEFVSAWRQAVASGFWEEFRRPFRRDSGESGPDRQRGALSDGARSRQKRRSPTPKGWGTWADLAADDRLQPVFELARSCHYEVGHTHQVTRLALRLFDQLAKVHRLDAERRFWLACGALLHDIGWVEGRAAHHKTALRLIRESPRLPWDLRWRRIVGSIARYHRKALPSAAQAEFAALAPADQADVRTLAAILRVADALDYSHQNVVDDVTCRVTPTHLSIRCTTTRAADVECARAVEKGDLAIAVFERELSVTWRLRKPGPADRS